MSVQPDRLKGSIPPLVTPFHNGEVDYDAYARLVAFQIKNGSHGIPMKYMMKRPGILASNEHRLPMVPATAELERRLDAVLKRVGLLGERAA